MPKEVFAVKNPRGEIYYPSITNEETLTRFVVVNRFWDSWENLFEAGWRIVRLTLSETKPA